MQNTSFNVKSPFSKSLFLIAALFSASVYADTCPEENALQVQPHGVITAVNPEGVEYTSGVPVDSFGGELSNPKFQVVVISNVIRDTGYGKLEYCAYRAANYPEIQLHPKEGEDLDASPNGTNWLYNRLAEVSDYSCWGPLPADCPFSIGNQRKVKNITANPFGKSK